MTDPITLKIQELVPEIMELKEGCRVSHFLKGTGTILRVEKHEGESDTYCLGFLALPEPIFEREPLNLNWEILGRPITLADVLRAIRENGKLVYVREDGSFYLEDEPLQIYYSGYFWNLALDWDNQTQKVKDFLGRLLGV